MVMAMTLGYNWTSHYHFDFFKSVFDNVLLEQGGPPHVLPLVVHLE